MKQRPMKNCGSWCCHFPYKVTICFKKWKLEDSIDKVVHCSDYLEIDKKTEEDYNMTREEIDIRSLELDIKETKLNRDEMESQKFFDDRRADINRERNELDIKSMELDVVDLKKK